MSDLWEYLGLLLWGWWGIALMMNGTLALITRASGWNLGRRWLTSAAIFMLLAAGYQAWHVERGHVRVAQSASTWRLSDVQKRYLAGKLIGFPTHTVRVLTLAGVADGEQYADDLEEIFKSLGWNAQRGPLASKEPVFGMRLRSAREDAADAFLTAIADMNGSSLWDNDASLPADQWEIVIGVRPGQ